jgi:hypothetical protein
VGDSFEPKSWDAAVREFYARAEGIMHDRQAKYGPTNVTSQGLYGIATRLSADKVARLMKALNGRVVEGRVILDPVPDDFSDESFDDTLMDIANYALIAWMLRHDYWTLPRE